MRATLCDPQLQVVLERDGFVVFPMLDASEVDSLRRSLDELGPPEDDPGQACHSSFHSHDADYKRRADHSVKAVLGPHLAARFDRQRALPSNFIVKWPGAMSGFGLHQDLSLVDERNHRSVEVWVALDDTDDRNGQLWMVPGSHTWFPDNIRGIHAFPFPYTDVARRVIARHSVPVPVRAGDAIVFTHAVLHFSMPNRSTEPRRVAIADLIPEEAEHLHYFGDGSGAVEVFSIDDEFWTDNNPFTLWQPPPRSRSIGAVAREVRQVTDQDLDRLVEEGRAIERREGPRGAINPARAWCHRCGSTDLDAPAPDRWVGNVTLLCDACQSAESELAPSAAHVGPRSASEARAGPAPVVDDDASPLSVEETDHGRRRPSAGRSATRPLSLPRARTLVDAVADHRLRHDGFVVVPGLLDGGLVKELRVAYGLMHGWNGTGFEPDLLNADVGYRHEVSDVLAHHLDPVVTDLFVDHRPYLRNFLCKWPGPDSDLYLHRDWTYVDERRGERSHVVWIALGDVTGHNGQLQVLRGSHRIDAMFRGTGLEAPWMEHESVIRERLESVPVRAGDAVVFDNALVHCSYPNHTGTARLVAAIGMRRRGVPLVYWRSAGPGVAERRDVDEEFFLCHTPTGLAVDPPPEAVVETAPDRAVELDASEFAQLLDGIARSHARPTARLWRWVVGREARRREHVAG